MKNDALLVIEPPARLQRDLDFLIASLRGCVPSKFFGWNLKVSVKQMFRMLSSATPVGEAVEPLTPASHSLAGVSNRLELALIPESKPKEEAAARCDTRPGNRITGQARISKASAEASKSSVLYIGNHGGEIRMVKNIFSRSSELK